MALFQVYTIKIRKEDREKADAILLKYWNNGDIDTVTNEEQIGERLTLVTYWIRPFVYEDLEAIRNEFKQAGIQMF